MSAVQALMAPILAEEQSIRPITLQTPVLGSHTTYEQLFSNPEIAAKNQQPVYADPKNVIHYMCLLSEAPPLTDMAEIIQLKKSLARAAMGNAVVVHAGLCAEDIDGISTNINVYAENFLDMMNGLKDAVKPLGKAIVPLGRYAGQFAKPRSNAYESDGKTMTFRGTNVNGPGTDDRVPSIERMSRGNVFASRALDALRRAERKRGIDHGGKIYASHEGLHLANEIGYMRSDNGQMYAGSAPLIWIGERTRDPHGLHVKFAAAVANPIGLKCGPTMKPEELQELIDILNPERAIPFSQKKEREKGKLVLIVRMGNKIDTSLPPLLDVMKQNGNGIVVMIDPMHGNTVTDPVSKKKTRKLDDINHEVQRFAELCAEAGVVAGGFHLEASGDDVAECLGGNVDALRDENYKTLCDPCLNPEQSQAPAKTFVQTVKKTKAMSVKTMAWALD